MPIEAVVLALTIGRLMPQRRHISIGLLLVAFVAGGVGGPVVHEVQHSIAERAHQSEAPCHAADVHQAEGPMWTGAAEDLFAPACDLCAWRLLVAQPTPVPVSTPHVQGPTTVEHRSHVAAAHVAADHFIRGPPSLPEARLA
jgi:hypothetical protein